MSDVVLVLGPVAFSDFEIPERVQFGGAQQLAVHKMPGGTRVIDALGPDGCEIRWRGIFAGPDATDRARLLDSLRVQGATLPLSWDVFLYSVVISSFDAEYRKNWWIPYRLSCTILQEDVGTALASLAVPPEQVSSDIDTAAGLASDAGMDLSAVESAVAASGATTPGTAAYTSALSVGGQAQDQIATAISGIEAQLSAASVVTPPAAAGTAAWAVAAIAQAASGTGNLAALSAANGYMGRALFTLANPVS